MERFKSILMCPLRDDDKYVVFRRIVDLAITNHATLTLFGVVPDAPPHFRLGSRKDKFDVAAAMVEEQERRLNHLASQCDDATVETVIATGNDAVEVVHQVMSGGHDLVVVSTDEGQQDSATINRLLRQCPCPVWVVRPERSRHQRVLAAVNPVPAEAELNRLIVDLAASAATMLGAELHVAHAWEMYGENLLRSPRYGAYSESEVEAERARQEAEVKRDLLALLDTGEGAMEPQVHLTQGSPMRAIVDLVHDHRISLLVLGSVARAGLAGLLMGNTAEHILNEVRCSIIAVKPPGFVSPVSPRRR